MRLCPRCNAATRVNGTDSGADIVIRYRRCLNPECGYRFKTVSSAEEILIKDHLDIPRAESVR